MASKDPVTKGGANAARSEPAERPSGHPQASQKEIDRMWSMMEDFHVCMLAVWDGHELHARPMSPYVRREEGLIYFLTDSRARTDDEIRDYDNVALTFTDTGDNRYLSVSGHARVEFNRDKIRQLWSTPAKAWWDNPDDPHIRVLRVEPVELWYWNSPGKLISYAKMLTAALTGARPDMGKSVKVGLGR